MKIDFDKYYTPKEVVDFCVEKVKLLGFMVEDIIEPSAGNGAFIDTLRKSFNCDITCYDIKPEHGDVVEQDFLLLDVGYRKNRLVIGNPPFGSRNSLAVKFFKKAVEISDYVAFILPASQLRGSKQLYDFDLVESFDLGIKNYSGVDLHCCFNIYKRPENGLNKKSKVSIVDGLTVVEYRRDKTDSYRNKVYCGNFHAICSWGGSLGVVPTEVGQYAMELYFYSEDETIKDVVRKMDWKNEISNISAKKLPKGLAVDIISSKLYDLDIDSKHGK